MSFPRDGDGGAHGELGCFEDVLRAFWNVMALDSLAKRYIWTTSELTS